MTPKQYEAARHELSWTNAEVARVVGKSERTLYRYLEDGSIPRDIGMLLRILAHLRLTTSQRKFQQILKELEL